MSFDSISPIDGRYRAEAEPLARYFTERALTKERVRVELAYLEFLMELGVAPKARLPTIRARTEDIKRVEERLGHDVKAVEVYIREALLQTRQSKLAPYVHLGLTSEDTNSTAFALLLRASLSEVLVPAYSSLAIKLSEIASREASTAMVARTHGRPAVPTTFGKEMAVFAVRISERVSRLRSLRPMAKVSGAVGTYASFLVLGEKDWPRELRRFVEGLGVDAATYSTQVVPGERLSDILHCVINLNQLILSLSRDLWLYQTLDYVHFLRLGKVSSSTMPQKVNPVDLENAEGQAEVSNSLLVLLAYRLQLTRMQRDLSDSVIRRMTGQALAHSYVAVSRVLASLGSMEVDRATMASDLGRHPEAYAEREQLLKRVRGDVRGYEKVKADIEKGTFIPGISGADSYLGFAETLARDCPSAVKRLLKASSRKPN